MLASMDRIGWLFPSAKEAVDDLGRSWHFLLDPPAAIVHACRCSVRRWRLGRLGSILPTLVPEACDVGPPSCSEGTLLVDYAGVLEHLLNGKPHQCLRWSRKRGGSLTSAITGGQWSQTRRAAVKQWGIDDTRCQLCFEELGTLDHRFVCDATRPAEGLPVMPAQGRLAAGRLGRERSRLLSTRGLLVLRVPAPPSICAECFSWIVAPPERDDAHLLTW